MEHIAQIVYLPLLSRVWVPYNLITIWLTACCSHFGPRREREMILDLVPISRIMHHFEKLFAIVIFFLQFIHTPWYAMVFGTRNVWLGTLRGLIYELASQHGIKEEAKRRRRQQNRWKSDKFPLAPSFSLSSFPHVPAFLGPLHCWYHFHALS